MSNLAPRPWGAKPSSNLLKLIFRYFLLVLIPAALFFPAPLREASARTAESPSSSQVHSTSTDRVESPDPTAPATAQAGDVFVTQDPSIEATRISTLQDSPGSSGQDLPTADLRAEHTYLRLLSTQTTISATGNPTGLPLQTSASLPPGTILLPATLVKTVDTSKTAWSPSSPDPAGIAYWPLTGRMLVVDSEVDEMPAYFTGVNVYDATAAGTLVSTCSTTNITRTGWSNEPTGLGINPANNRLYISDDDKNKVFEVSLGADGVYCTADDTVTSASFATDTEDVAYGDNKLFIAGGVRARVYQFPLGPDGVLGGGDDGPITSWDTASLGFNDLEGIDYNPETGTLFIVSTAASDKYLGEVTTSGELLHAWDLAFMGPQSNIRSDVTYAPSSSNPLKKNIYIVSRGLDNDSHPTENDGKWWEISLESISVVNDDFGAATIIPGVPYTNTLATTGATKAPDDPDLAGCGRTAGSASVWYDFQAPKSGLVYLDTFGSDYDTMIGVWTGSRGNLTEVACNDNAGGGSQSQLELPATMGTTYHIGISQYNPGSVTLVGGNLVLHATSFKDVPGTQIFWRYIEGFYKQGITTGCGASPRLYCPLNDVTRAEMAVFLLRARHGAGYVPPASTGIFTDVPVAGKEWMQPWIEQFYREGITSGCGVNPLRYCPEANVTRAEMAVFVLRATHGAGYVPPAPTGIFADVPVAGKEWMQPWIEQFYRQGITSGCAENPLRYCPENNVTRQEMAVFISRAYGIPQLP